MEASHVQRMRLDPLRRSVTDLQIDRLAEAIELIRLYDTDHGSHEISISVLTTLLYVGSRNDCHKQALEEDLPLMTRASTSRNTDMISKHHRIVFPSGKRKPGLGLVRKEVDVSDRRRSVLTLTKKGEKLFTKIKDVLYGET